MLVTAAVSWPHHHARPRLQRPIFTACAKSPAQDHTLHLLQIIRAEMISHVRRTEDGTPWEVQLTRGVVHPNIVRCLAYGTFQDDVRGGCMCTSECLMVWCSMLAPADSEPVQH